MKLLSISTTVLSLVAALFLSSNQVQAQTELASNKVYETVASNNIYYEEQNKSFQAVIFQRLNGRVSVNVSKNADTIVKVRVLNSKGMLLNEDSIKRNNLVARQYSLSGFPKGTYIIEVASDRKMIRKEITLD